MCLPFQFSESQVAAYCLIELGIDYYATLAHLPPEKSAAILKTMQRNMPTSTSLLKRIADGIDLLIQRTKQQ
jgi:hypothetical protein